MGTVHTWILNSHTTNNIPLPQWNYQDRSNTPRTSLDGVFVLNKGFVKLDNTLLSLNNQQTLSNGIYTISDNTDSNILMLFLSLQEACNNIDAAWLNSLAYVNNVSFSNVRTI